MVSEVHSHSKILGVYFRDDVFFYIYIFYSSTDGFIL